MQPPHMPVTPCGRVGEDLLGPRLANAPQLPEQMLAHLRTHEYPPFMDYHMRQGMTWEEARGRWEMYEHARMTGQA